MEPFAIEGEVHLTCELADDGVIYLEIGGNVSSDTIDYFIEWAEKVKEAMRESHKMNPNRVLTLIDTRRIHEVDMDSIGELNKLMEHNKQYATKTAVFGGNYFVRILAEMALHMTGRKNMKLFDTREDAVAWLFDDSKGKKKEA